MEYIILIKERDNYENSEYKNLIKFKYFLFFLVIYFWLYIYFNLKHHFKKRPVALYLHLFLLFLLSLSPLSKDNKQKSCAPTQNHPV